ncbi:hypothetical protein [Agrococcus jejuensis]|uniref:hypothetical protein n=1 Tax=Agrococcus jejuensis TaxID=399736 RepID=UPI0011A2947A|nr:hypothetical protein [Agrococcus jejuensis]
MSVKAFVVLAVVVVVAAGGAGAFAYLSHLHLASTHVAFADAEDRLEIARDDHADRVAQEQAAASAAAAAEDAAEAQALEESVAADLGLTPAGPPGLYLQWAPTTDFTCGYWDCAAFVLVSFDATCSSMVYVEANIVSGSTVVGFTNATLGSLRPGETGVVMLENFSGLTGDFQLTQVNCW